MTQGVSWETAPTIKSPFPYTYFQAPAHDLYAFDLWNRIFVKKNGPWNWFNSRKHNIEKEAEWDHRIFESSIRLLSILSYFVFSLKYQQGA